MALGVQLWLWSKRGHDESKAYLMSEVSDPKPGGPSMIAGDSQVTTPPVGHSTSDHSTRWPLHMATRQGTAQDRHRSVQIFQERCEYNIVDRGRGKYLGKGIHFKLDACTWWDMAGRWA